MIRAESDAYKKSAKSILLFLVRFSPVLFVVGPAFFAKGYLFFTDFVWGPNSVAISGWTSSAFLVNVASEESVYLICKA